MKNGCSGSQLLHGSKLLHYLRIPTVCRWPPRPDLGQEIQRIGIHEAIVVRSSHEVLTTAKSCAIPGGLSPNLLLVELPGNTPTSVNSGKCLQTLLTGAE